MTKRGNMVRSVERLVASPLIALIWLYRMLVSPLLGTNCRHLPACSEYARDALLRHGPLRGGWFALKRISRCHPWAAPMLDPVPDTADDSRPECCRRP